MAASDFFDAPAPWSRYKHDILGKYLHTWSSKLQYRNKDLVFVDACAGRGTYDDGSPGSPVLAAGLNDELLAKHHARLTVVACEKDPAAAKALALELEPWASRTPPLAIIHPRPFEEVLDAIVAVTRDRPTFFFIDPYGIKSLKRERLRPLLEDRGREPTEVLMRVDSRALERISGWWRRKERNERGQKTAESCRELLADLGIGEEVVKEAAGTNQRGARLLRAYLEDLHARFRFVRTIPIRSRYDGAVKYHLVHATDHADGLILSNDVVSGVEDDLFEDFDRDDTQTELFAPKRPPRASRKQLLAYIRAVLSDELWMPFRELQVCIVRKFESDFRSRDHRRAVKQLRDDGQLELRPADRAIRPTTRLRLTTAPDQARPPRPHRRRSTPKAPSRG